MVTYFLDTYALIEIIKGNELYLKYIDEEAVTSIFNLYELYYTSLKDNGSEIAKNNFFQLKGNLIRFGDDEIFLASKFKLENKKQGISYTDALGYTIAINNDMLFVTGDKEFRNMPKVEFVK